MSELEQAAIDKRRAEEALKGHIAMNVYGRTPEDLDAMAVDYAKAQVAYQRASNKLDEIIKKQAQENL